MGTGDGHLLIGGGGGGGEAESAGDGNDEEGREGEGKLSTDAGRFSYIGLCQLRTKQGS